MESLVYLDSHNFSCDSRFEIKLSVKQKNERENEKVTTLTTVLLELAKKAPEITINPSGAKRSYEHIVVRCILNFRLIVGLSCCRNIDAGAKLDQKNGHTHESGDPPDCAPRQTASAPY